MSNDDKARAAAAQLMIDDEPDDWDKRIFSTGCADENAKLTDCYYDKKDWRGCKQESQHQKAANTVCLDGDIPTVLAASWEQ
ncbi:hypothetical protein BM1_08739 [Bipolaris maydis]|nr:hypothetical protein BM1_08739 [Bipolaris maydis]